MFARTKPEMALTSRPLPVYGSEKRGKETCEGQWKCSGKARNCRFTVSLTTPLQCCSIRCFIYLLIISFFFIDFAVVFKLA